MSYVSLTRLLKYHSRFSLFKQHRSPPVIRIPLGSSAILAESGRRQVRAKTFPAWNVLREFTPLAGIPGSLVCRSISTNTLWRLQTIHGQQKTIRTVRIGKKFSLFLSFYHTWPMAKQIHNVHPTTAIPEYTRFSASSRYSWNAQSLRALDRDACNFQTLTFYSKAEQLKL